jgi:hypothetical protein
MSEIFVCKPGTLSTEHKADLKEGGVIVIEMENPKEFKLIRSEPDLDAGALLTAALIGLSTDSDHIGHSASKNRAVFVDELAKALIAKGRHS